MADSTPYKVPAEPGRWFAIGLAAAVHAVLFAILWIGVRWENEAPTAVDAEIWTEQAQQTPTPRPQPVPEPVAKAEPKPEPQPVIKELLKPVQKQPEPLVKNPDIALEQEKKRKLLEQQRLAEAKLREQEKAKAEKQKLAAELKQAEADKQRKLQQAEAEAEQRRKQAEAEQRKKQQQAEAAEKRKQEQAAAEKKRKQQLAQEKAAQAAAEKAAADERHAENLKRLMTQAGAGSTGGSAKAQGGAADGRYIDRIRTKIKSNTIFNVPPSLGDNPAVEYAIDLLPDGSLRGMRKLKSSGVTGFDEAVALAIERSQPFPPDDSGKIPARLTITHRPKDQ